MPIWADSAFLNTDVFGIMNYGEGHDDADEYEVERKWSSTAANFARQYRIGFMSSTGTIG